MAKNETMKFDAEVGKILQLMIHSLYTNKDIFLRELISNASDACDKLRYSAITSPELLSDDTELKIKISINEKNRTVTISDNGIGMSRKDLIENLGTIARSGTQSFMEQMTGDSKKDLQLIGQFGVGFYSSFMVADEVTVTTKKAAEADSWIWSSKGDGEFTISKATGKHNRGTSICLHLKEGEDDFIEKFRLKHIITTYSDHISIPIELLDAEGKADMVNKASALWTRPKSDITPEQYNEFYKHVSHSPDQPWLILHNKNEGAVEFTNLLFIPSRKPFDLFHPDRKPRVKLYVKRVFITDESVNLVPAYMRFLRGVVDSEDLPLNISRETLQHNHIIEKIKKSVVKRVILELKKKLETDEAGYLEFWQNFGAVIKEGLCEGMENRENLLEICLFRSAITGKLITLDQYIANMKEGQDQIYYYISDEDPEHLKTSPQLEGFLKRDIDVLLFSDNVDDFWVNVEHQYKEKELKSVTRSGIELDKIAGSEEKQDIQEPKEEELTSLIAYFTTTLGPLVKEVKFSYKLIDSPVCLTVAEGAMDIRMERFLIGQKQLVSSSAKILEINPKHPIINKMKLGLENGKNLEDLVRVLYDQACIIEGEPISDASGFSRRMNHFLQEALVA